MHLNVWKQNDYNFMGDSVDTMNNLLHFFLMWLFFLTIEWYIELVAVRLCSSMQQSLEFTFSHSILCLQSIEN